MRVPATLCCAIAFTGCADAGVPGDPHAAGDSQVAGDSHVAGDPHVAGDTHLAGDTHVAGDPNVVAGDPVATLPNIVLDDCDGNAHSVRDLGPRDAAWMFVFAGWWPTCLSRAGSANALYEDFSAEDFEAYFIISETGSFGTPTSAYCQQIRAQYGLTMPVLVDPAHEIQSALGVPLNDVDIVMRRGEVTLADNFVPEAQVRAAIQAALAGN